MIDNKMAQTVYIDFVVNGEIVRGSFTGPAIVENNGMKIKVRDVQITEPFELSENCYFGELGEDK